MVIAASFWFWIALLTVSLIITLGVIWEGIGTDSFDTSSMHGLYCSVWSVSTTVLCCVVVLRLIVCRSIESSEASDGSTKRRQWHSTACGSFRLVPVLVVVVLACLFTFSSLMMVSNYCGWTTTTRWNWHVLVTLEASIKAAAFIALLVWTIWKSVLGNCQTDNEIASLLEEGKAPLNLNGYGYQSMAARGPLDVPLAL